MGEMQAGNTGKDLKYAKYLTVIPALTMHYKNDVQIQIIVQFVTKSLQPHTYSLQCDTFYIDFQKLYF